ncbi:MAG: hypothetical protein A2Y21_03755 [Clostridiales bacterium GWC2_40_7]|nr:MAG: hypothetical protein A2Y21_03755 [Clostridiales bacterium GWC2_40_7]
MLKRTVLINNPLGLHARPAANLVTICSCFKSVITIIFNGKIYNAKSAISLMMAGIKSGSEVELIVDGVDEYTAIEEIEQAITGGLGE